MARRNALVFGPSSVSWTLDEDSVETMAVRIPDMAEDEGDRYLLTIKNASAVVSLSCAVQNTIPDMDADTVAEVSDLVSFNVAPSSTRSVVVEGFPMGTAGRLAFTKSAITAAAFSVYVELRRA